jgi:nitroreductase
VGRIELETDATIADLLDLMRRRRSCRRYTSDPVHREAVDNIIEAGRWAPSGCSSEPWELIVVEDEGNRKELADIYVEARKWSEHLDGGEHGFPFPDMSYLYDVPTYIVVVGDRRLAQTYPELFYRYPIYQQSMAACIQNMFLAAAVQGLGATWLSTGNKLEPPLIELFDVPHGYRIETILAIGWPNLERQLRDRRPTDEIVHHETFDPDRARSDDDIRGYVRAIRDRRRADREMSGETPNHLGFEDSTPPG